MNNEYAATAYAEHIGSQDDSRWVTQTKFYDPSQPPEVCTGNCTEAAFASLFGIGLDDVPSMQGLAGSDYWDALESFVRSRGYSLWMQPPSHYPVGLYLADGPSERGCGHFVVMRDGKMVHDPHPSRAGLLNVERVWSLTALDPAALSAQPSPGSQDALADAARRVISDVDSGDYGGTISMATYDALVAALAARQPVVVDLPESLHDRVEALREVAARQPVGEPVFRERSTHKVYRGSCGNLPCHCWADTDHIVGDEVKRYATQPAQAVDLGQLRELLDGWKNSDYPLSYEGQHAQRALNACIKDLQGLIDSQAVGNG